MLVMKKEIPNQYCAWLFDVLFTLESRLDISGYSGNDRRVFGFVGERLMDKRHEFHQKETESEAVMNDPLISVIVPVYNSEHCLEKCIESIIHQDHGHFELILVDDGSTDRSGEICEQWAGKDGRVKVFHKENGGQSAARNLGLDRAGGAFISFVDSDDRVTPDYLSYLLSLFPEDDSCGITACNHYIVRNGHPVPGASEEADRVFSAKEALENTLFHGCIDIAPWGKLYRRDIFAGLRYPEGRIFEDTWLFGDVVSRTEKIVFGCRCCYYYMIHEESTVRKAYSSRNLQYIEAAEKLAADAMKYGQDMRTGGIRRVNHARLSVLRYMEHCGKPDRMLRKKLREDILKEAPLYLDDTRTPKRDRVAVSLLRLGLIPFYTGWRLYSELRRQ